MLHGVDLEPGDLDVTPALDRENLGRLAAALRSLDARPDPDGFGSWVTDPSGERRWVPREPRPDEAAWQPDADDPRSFDHLFVSRLGAVDVVPEVSGTYDELAPRAVALTVAGRPVHVESIEDLLATLTVARRERDTGRVRALRALQRQAMVSRTIGRDAGGSSETR
jgi:hypothetical protein